MTHHTHKWHVTPIQKTCGHVYLDLCYHDMQAVLIHCRVMSTSGVKLIGKQACLSGRKPLVLAAGSVTYQTKSSALETQLLPSHQPLQVCKLQVCKKSHMKAANAVRAVRCACIFTSCMWPSAYGRQAHKQRQPHYTRQTGRRLSVCLSGLFEEQHRAGANLPWYCSTWSEHMTLRVATSSWAVMSKIQDS